MIDLPEREAAFEEAAAEARAIAEPVSPSESGDGEQPASSGSAPTPPPAPEEARRNASLFVAEMVPFGALAPFRGEHWRITKAQVEELAPLWAEVLDKYYPEWWKNAGPEIRLGVAVGFVVLAKYQIEKQMMKELEKQIEEAHATQPIPSQPAPPSPAPADAPPTPPASGWQDGPTAAPPPA